MKNVIKKLGMSAILLVALTISSGTMKVQAVGDADSKATIEFTEAWDPELPKTSGEPTPTPNPDPTNPPKKVLTLPQTSDATSWQYSALGVLVIGAGAVINVQIRRKEEV